jgi:hypothetical protein
MTRDLNSCLVLAQVEDYLLYISSAASANITELFQENAHKKQKEAKIITKHVVGTAWMW